MNKLDPAVTQRNPGFPAVRENETVRSGSSPIGLPRRALPGRFDSSIPRMMLRSLQVVRPKVVGFFWRIVEVSRKLTTPVFRVAHSS
jgi:hypothetical protein